MRNLVGTILMAITMGAAGCQTQAPAQPKESMTSRSVMDVTPASRVPRNYGSPEMVTPPDEPVPAPAVAPLLTTTPDASSASTGHPRASARPAAFAGDTGSASGTAYKVKKGDTLFRIAKTQYGDGKKWTQIASANPGVSPQSLRVGQMIVVP